MKRKELKQEDLYNLWLQPYHGITVQELIEKEPELTQTPEWYKRYSVSQSQHDEWYAKAIDIIAKYYRCGKKVAKRKFIWDYLNIAPSIKQDENSNP
jgi:hypothetical protein